jgi:hypothetical protein
MSTVVTASREYIEAANHLLKAAYPHVARWPCSVPAGDAQCGEPPVAMLVVAIPAGEQGHPDGTSLDEIRFEDELAPTPLCALHLAEHTGWRFGAFHDLPDPDD